MKCDIFSAKTSAVMEYFLQQLPETTYWCHDMMKMLVYMADWKSSLVHGTQISDTIWKAKGWEGLEATNLEGMEHWECHVDPPSFWSRVSGLFTSKESILSEEEKAVLDYVIKTKTRDEYRIGSLPFRRLVFSTWPLLGPARDGGGATIYLRLPELVEDYVRSYDAEESTTLTEPQRVELETI